MCERRGDERGGRRGKWLRWEYVGIPDNRLGVRRPREDRREEGRLARRVAITSDSRRVGENFARDSETTGYMVICGAEREARKGRSTETYACGSCGGAYNAL